MDNRENLMNIELDEVYGIWETSFWQTVLGKGILLLGALSAVFLCYTVFKVFKRYRMLSAKDRALGGLRSLKQKIEHKEQDPKKIYQTVTDLLKMYAQWRFRVERGLSDYELITALESDVEDKDEKGLRRIMSQAQAVKFGLASAQKAQMVDDIDTVIDFITTTEKEQQKRGNREV